MRKYFDSVSDPLFGQAVQGATAQLNAFPGGGAAQLFSDAGGLSPIQNPVVTDGNGYFEFYAADGHYTLIVTSPNGTVRNVNDLSIGPQVGLTASGNYDPPSLTNGSSASVIVPVTGCVLGDFAVASFSLDTQGITIAAAVSSAGNVRVTFTNNTGGTIDLAVGVVRVRLRPAAT